MGSVITRYVRRRWRVPLHILGIAALLVWLVGFAPIRPKQGQTAARADKEVVTTGVVESVLTKSVGSVFDGSVQTVKAWRGKHVKKGELLFKMDASPYVAELQQARAELALASQELRDTRVQREQDLAALRAEVRSLEGQLAEERHRARAAAQQQSAVSVDPAVGTPVASAPVARYDPVLQSALTAQVQDARSRLAEQGSVWAPIIAEASANVSRSAARVRELKEMVASAERRSPADGIVTAILAKPGDRVARRQPVVRVDNPKGYRIVTLVDEEAKEPLKPGVIVPMRRNDGIATGKLEKIVPGWDDQVFQYYLWVKPNRTDGLWPGQSVQVELPRSSQVASAF